MDSKKDDKKICFIMCANNDLYSDEAIYYLNRLVIPNGYTADILCVKEANSMCAGYNEGMNASNAKYKVYLHHDVFIMNEHFISDMVKLFENTEIGMIGMVGSPELNETAVMWCGERIGSIYSGGDRLAFDAEIPVQKEFLEVEAIDGLLMATQYDIPWREDLFTDWDFYDISQSFEFIKQGYKVVVPNMSSPWCFHDESRVNLENYYKNRQIFINEYQ